MPDSSQRPCNERTGLVGNLCMIAEFQLCLGTARFHNFCTRSSNLRQWCPTPSTYQHCSPCKLSPRRSLGTGRPGSMCSCSLRCYPGKCQDYTGTLCPSTASTVCRFRTCAMRYNIDSRTRPRKSSRQSIVQIHTAQSRRRDVWRQEDRDDRMPQDRCGPETIIGLQLRNFLPCAVHRCTS